MNKTFKGLLIILIFIYFIQPGFVSGDNVHNISILSGKAKLLKFETEIIRASITNTEVADIVVISPNELLINAKSSGSTSLVVWDKDEKAINYDITVGIDITGLRALLKELAPDDNIEVIVKDNTVVLQGEVKKHHTIDHINKVIETFDEDVINIMRVKVPEQIMLQVKFAEVNRSTVKELGFDFFTGVKNDFGFGSLPNNLITELSPNGNITNWSEEAMENVLQITSGSFSLDVLFDNLEKRGLLRILAEPNLVSISGEEASFLAGGEIPIPILTANVVSVVWKEFGVKLNFVPTVTEADTIRLEVEPEVSILDWSNSVKFGGFEIPALVTRKAKTVVELKKGESLIIGGLISNITTESNNKIAGLGDIPILGALFRSKSFKRSETELIVLVTPRIVRPVFTADKEEAFSPEKITELFKKGKVPYKDEQADAIKKYFNPTILEDAKTLDEIEEMEKKERQEELKRKKAEKALRKSEKKEPKTNFGPKKKTKELKAINEARRKLRAKEKLLARKEKELLKKDKLSYRNRIKRQKALDATDARLQKEQSIFDSKQKKALEEKEQLLAREKKISERENVIELIMEVNRRIAKEYNKEDIKE